MLRVIIKLQQKKNHCKEGRCFTVSNQNETMLNRCSRRNLCINRPMVTIGSATAGSSSGSSHQQPIQTRSLFPSSLSLLIASSSTISTTSSGSNVSIVGRRRRFLSSSSSFNDQQQQLRYQRKMIGIPSALILHHHPASAIAMSSLQRQKWMPSNRNDNNTGTKQKRQENAIKLLFMDTLIASQSFVLYPSQNYISSHNHHHHYDKRREEERQNDKEYVTSSVKFNNNNLASSTVVTTTDDYESNSSNDYTNDDDHHPPVDDIAPEFDNSYDDNEKLNAMIQKANEIKINSDHLDVVVPSNDNINRNYLLQQQTGVDNVQDTTPTSSLCSGVVDDMVVALDDHEDKDDIDNNNNKFTSSGPKTSSIAGETRVDERRRQDTRARVKDELYASVKEEDRMLAMRLFNKALQIQRIDHHRLHGEANITLSRKSFAFGQTSSIKSRVTDFTIDPQFMPPSLLNRLFTIVGKHPMDAYLVLLYYQQLMPIHRSQLAEAKKQLDRQLPEKEDVSEPNEEQSAVPAQDYNDVNTYTSMYVRVCYAMQFLHQNDHNYTDAQNLVRTLLSDINKLNRAGQERCFPMMVSSMAKQRSSILGKMFTRLLYDHMIKEKFQIPAGWYVHVLQHSRFWRMRELPYAQILNTAVVELGCRPIPGVAFSVIDNLFPYTNTADTKLALQAIQFLQKPRLQNEDEQQTSYFNDHDDYMTTTISSSSDTLEQREEVDRQMPRKEDGDIVAEKKGNRKAKVDNYVYIIDIATLELVSSAAATTGDVELNMMVWDLLDMYGFQPTPSIYESTAVVFSWDPSTYQQAFAVVLDMERQQQQQSSSTDGSDGNNMNLVPSRALIRGISTQIRVNPENLKRARNEIHKLHQKGTPISVALLNIVMSAAAERGDSSMALSVLMDDYDRYQIQPDSDAYSFAFEAMGKHIHRARKFSNAAYLIDECLMNAEKILSWMDEDGIAPTEHIIRQYVELLCEAGQIDTATDVIFDAHNDIPGCVNNKTLYRVAMSNSKIRKFDVARKIANCATIPILNLHKNIDVDERNANYLAMKEKERQSNTTVSPTEA